MTVSRRTALVTAGACLLAARPSRASTSISRELRRMVGFQIVASDDVRQAWQSVETSHRYIQLRQMGLFRQVAVAGLNPAAFSEVIVFAKPVDPSLRQQYPGLSARAYFDYRLLIDGEFYHVVAWD